MDANLGTPDDREEIRELYARYAFAIDEGNSDEWIDCFTDDGVFESQRFGKHTGKEELRKFTSLYRESLGGALVRHVIANVSFQIEGDEGAGRCYLIYYHCKDGRVQQAAIGSYRDRLRKSGGHWKFQSRQVTLTGHH